MINRFIQRIKTFKKQKAIIFGTSYQGRLAFNILASYNIETYKFIDNNKQKQGFKTYGVDILAPELLKEINDFIVIVPSMYYKEMHKQLTDMGIAKKDIYNIDIYDTANMLYDVPYKLKFYMMLNKFSSH